jgi:hypothetical protein
MRAFFFFERSSVSFFFVCVQAVLPLYIVIKSICINMSAVLPLYIVIKSICINMSSGRH